MMHTTTNAEPHALKSAWLTWQNSVLILVCVLLLILWLHTDHQVREMEYALSHKLNDYQTINQQSKLLAEQASAQSTSTNAQVVLLEQKLAESRTQQEALQALYEQLAENRESTALAEVEQLISIAAQQLQLAGNANAALLALTSAEKRLQPIQLPRALPLREAINLDIARLRDLPQIDMIQMSAELETLSKLCEKLPLISERQPTLNAQAPIAKPPQNWLTRAWQTVWHDIQNLVTIERIDKPEPPLLAPHHAYYLRENLRLRLLAARVSLLHHDETTYRADLAAAKQWLTLYYDAQHPNAKLALGLLNKLSAKTVHIELPQLNESMSAIERYKLTLDKRGNAP